jgi:hypothetical protein
MTIGHSREPGANRRNGDIMSVRGWRWRVFLGTSVACSTWGCSDEPSSGTTFTNPDASGGTGGSGVGGAINIPRDGGAGVGGSSATGGVGGGGVVSPTLHECPPASAPPETCPVRLMQGSFSTSTGSLAELEGVTELTGALEIDTLDGLDALGCLGRVDEVTIELDSDDVGTLWGLRNLVFVGGSVDLIAGGATVHIDCGLRSLESLGSEWLTGGAVDFSGRVKGILDLSRLREVTHIRISGSELESIVLPNNVTLTMGQLGLQNNSLLAAVSGFQNVTIQPSGIQVSGAYSVNIVNNARLSTCRANELAGLWLNAGFSSASITISGNAPDC